jgi:hypothetical protein
MMRRVLFLALLVVTAPALARDALGIFGTWAAFRDPATPRCYAIAMAAPSTMQRDFQLHFRLSRKVQPGAPISLSIGGQRLGLTGGGGDAWAADKRGDAAIIAAMRSAGQMIVSARDADGRGFSNTYPLDGVATALDAAALGCAQLR